MLDMPAIKMAKDNRRDEMPDDLEELVKSWRTKMEECNAAIEYDDSFGSQCLKQKELEEIVSIIAKKV